MAVKDIVRLFESKLPGAASEKLEVGHDGLSQTKGFKTSRMGKLSQPTPVQFIEMPRMHHDISNKDIPTIPLSSPATDTTPYDPSVITTTDVTEDASYDRCTTSSTLFSRSTISKPSNTHKAYPLEREENQGLLRNTHVPPKGPIPPVSLHFHPNHLVPHTPVPATVIFARGAAPLYLPKLDNYLASLSRPLFCPSKGGKDKPLPMFAPMDRLAASGKTLTDLELNSQVIPAWRNRQNIFGSLVSIVLGIMGSSALATYYSLQGLSNTVQIFALILSTIVPVGGQGLADKWQRLFLGTIPKILALNLASTLIQSVIYLIIFMAISFALLYYFYRSTFDCNRYSSVEGLQQPGSRGNQVGLVVASFLLTVIYLPLSTMAVHVLVWSQDLWVVPNPYINATTFPPVLSPLGPADEYRDPLDFCWTTTMKRNDVNYAPVIVIISAAVLLLLTIWFPVCLRRVIRQSVPKVDPYTELGRPRTRNDMDREYQRLLVRDQNPFAFLYRGFRRGWGTFESTYLFAKLSTLLIVAVIDPDNCLFRSLSRTRLAVARQVVLLLSTIAFFVLQCILAPFLDPVNNASEWTSRLNYVATSVVALLVTLDIPGKAIIGGPVLYAIYIITYGLSFYFIVINLDVMHRVVKRIARRIDFSIDIFSPRLDISPTSIHTRRRIWQESITTLLLTSPECEIPKRHRMKYAQARDSEYPPYLLDFSGSPGERHVENLKILREVGFSAYNKGVALVYGPDQSWFKYIEEAIQRHFVGPDCYWKSPNEPSRPGLTKGFGNAWWIPFPPTLVIRYDDGPLTILREVSDFQSYIAQNSSREVRRRREIRLSIRALDGQTVIWPYEHIELVGAHSLWCCKSRRYETDTSVHYRTCLLRIKRRGHMVWKDLQLGSGLDVELTYAKNVRVNGGIIGLTDDYELTPALARFLSINQDLIRRRLKLVEAMLDGYRRHYRRECYKKINVLTYRFLTYVYDQPRDPTSLAKSSIEFERDLRVRQLMVGSEAVFEAAYERLAAVSTSEAATWWYIFWDDLWRRNHDTISALELHASDFDSHYPTSIAYTPLPRSALEAFLTQRGLFSKVPRWGDFFHSGFLNKLYLRLNECVFRGSKQAIMFHVGDDPLELDMEDVDLQTNGRPSTLGTGGGTDHDDEYILARPAYRWEGLLDDPLNNGEKWRGRWFAKLGVWLGLASRWQSEAPSKGVSFDVRLENGRYVLIDETGSTLNYLRAGH